MTPYYADDTLTLYCGDAATALAELPAASVHCVVTSPPYWGLRDYGMPGQLGLEPTPEEYVERMVAVFREVRRVLRADGTFWSNMGDSYAQSGKGGGGPFEAERPGYLPGVRGRPLRAMPGGETADGVLKPKDLIGIPWRLAFALQADGWYLRSDIIWAKPNPMPESVTDRPTKSHEYMFLLAKAPRYYYDAEAVREPHQGPHAGHLQQHFAPLKDRGDQRQLRKQGYHDFINPTGRNLRSVWTIATEPYPGAHFATFPQKLVEPCIKAGCPENGVVLDPFAGTGTTGLVANRLGRRAILIDLSVDYMTQLLARNAQAPLGLGG